MRIDHHAYQRATRVAGVGFLVQLGIGLTLLVFALLAKDTPFLFGSLFVLLGLPVWLALIVIFNQHKLERLEALEEDELATTRPETGSAFETGEEEIRVAARRLRLMHKWLMPILSLLVAAGLGVMAWLMLRYLSAVGAGEAEFLLTRHVGWAVAVCLAFSALSFIFSRFVAGMSKQTAWQNLRGGAAYMVGNSVVALAIAVGIGFRFFNKEGVITAIVWAIPIFMIVLAAEIVLNFILNLYRPRVPGEVPRPAFDSKVLSMFAAPDNLVKSINEAVNYQFGFDVTSSWGYQLLLRSFAWLLALGALVLIVLNMMVIVEPNQQAVKLARGEIVGDSAHGSGIMWKLPWPFQSAERYDVTKIRELPLTATQIRGLDQPRLWKDDLKQLFDTEPDPFIVSSFEVAVEDPEVESALAQAGGEDEAALDEESRRVAGQVSLINAEIVLQYRIKPDGGLMDYLRFSSDTIARREALTTREKALRALALREASQYFARHSLDEVLAARRLEVSAALREQVQSAFDEHHTGIEVVAVSVPLVRPAGGAAAAFVELSISDQARQELIARAEQEVATTFAVLIGDPAMKEPVLEAIDEWQRRKEEFGLEAAETVAQRVKVEQMLVDSGGQVARLITESERDRWVRLMEARAEASRLRAQLISYRAAPRLYRQRETMNVYSNTLPELRKYILGIDPSRVSFDFELTELNPLLNVADALKSETEGE
ncbi:MAG: SPFH domain-containing protein [Planctomycetota bacterium]|nr:SPFH domain-containing protein [Planctomycetota bacterium]